MLRGRGKDARAKPSSGSARPDRRTSSRGVELENEAMRFRTLEMASEVDQQHSDMRKLRRENDALKQQLWTMRDEYQRLEEFVEELEEVALEDIVEEEDDEPEEPEEEEEEEEVVEEEEEEEETEDRGSGAGASGRLDMPAFDAEFALRGAGAGPHRTGGFTVLLPDRGPITIPDIPSSSPDGLPDPDEFFSPTKHFNLDQLMDIVHSFHVERDRHCISPAAARRGSGAADGAFGGAMPRRTEPGPPAGVVVTQSVTHATTASDGSRTVTFRRDSVLCVGGDSEAGAAGSAHSRCSSASDGSVARYAAQQATLLRINCVEPNTVMFSTRQHPALRGLSALHVIDELERQLDSRLCEVRGVRVVSDTAYVCLGSRASLLLLLGCGLTVRGVPVSLVDITHDSAVVMMTGVPHYISDGTIHVLMDTFGTVIGEIERRFYKGVDTGDRFLRVKLCDGVKVPHYVTVGGNKITMRIVPPDEVGCALRPEQCRLNSTRNASTHTSQSNHRRLGSDGSEGAYGGAGGAFFAGTGACGQTSPAASAASPAGCGSETLRKQGFTSHLQVQLRPRSAPDPAAGTVRGSAPSSPADVLDGSSAAAHLSMLVNTSDGQDSSPQPPPPSQPPPAPPPPQPPPTPQQPGSATLKRRGRRPFLPRIRLPGAAATPAEPAAPASSSSELDSSKSSPDKLRRAAGASAGDRSPDKLPRSLNSSPTKSVESRDSPLKHRGSVAFDESSGADSPPKRRQARPQANGGILRRQVSEIENDSPQPSPDSLRRRALGDPVRARLAERIERRRARSMRRDSELSELSEALERRGSEGAGSLSSRGTKAGSSLPDSSDVPWCGCWGNGCF
ncbi:hypothetical protein FJT64_020212 [Amphibalanus amphitrite]|uniref:Uncharacterized protein n=1 Tax=Amphibalanus amphitrite TaxID=1232801 RepID=A0A6A4X2I2_AMPAM|nr:hypothetical protein FJT64_020212 [Amphibalanus amphitrite]